MCWQPVAERFGLTEREYVVAKLAGRGLSNREIASAIGVALPTVCAHLSNVFRKVGLGDRYKLIRLFAEEEFRGAGQ